MRRLRLRAAGAVLASALLLSGCSAAPQGIDEGTAQTLDDAVVAVAERASAEDYPGALAELAGLQSALDSALAGGSVSAERAATVQARVDAVRADLDALVGGADDPTPVRTPSSAPGQTTPEETGPVEEDPEPAPAATEEAPAPEPTPEEPVETPEEPVETPEEPVEPAEPTEEAPGAPGNSGDAPGRSGDSSGSNGDAPATGGDSSGNGGSAPGAGGDSSGPGRG
ncbi:hypothetical protein [Rathayibacter tanaceti]|uniref:Uncharacterized protein n=2 Tax=Rathayibacter tanaceti TaxID=1671680 RepID=A0A162J3F9_9MICO|nr:hypothetical protein [Rathayibacter tanaceti]KZX21627.1 hypothetical protein ACH61_01229 [Rathayibacter tanaceti]QHC56488.1 hypothetical protein GSU10_13190 [Rathayibacter tanaceti]TCO36696.1 hypothetical protein EV639_10699 [Rathayibacter tanaceti]